MGFYFLKGETQLSLVADRQRKIQLKSASP